MGASGLEAGDVVIVRKIATDFVRVLVPRLGRELDLPPWPFADKQFWEQL
jgi:hypothetical protein